MTLLLLGLVLFFAVHTVPMLPTLRASVLAKTGRGAYMGLFSLVSLLGLILIVIGYGDLRTAGAANPELWAPPTWIRHLVFLLMLVSFILLAAAYVPSRIRDAVGHPMLAAIKVWAFSHLLANGDLASVLLFGSFLAFAVIDRISVKRRAPEAAVRGPLGDRTGGLAGDLTVVAVGVGAYVVMMMFGHDWLIGIPLINA